MRRPFVVPTLSSHIAPFICTWVPVWLFLCCSSFWETLTNFIKGNLGPGVLGLSFAFAYGGFIVSAFECLDHKHGT